MPPHRCRRALNAACRAAPRSAGDRPARSPGSWRWPGTWRGDDELRQPRPLGLPARSLHRTTSAVEAGSSRALRPAGASATRRARTRPAPGPRARRRPARWTPPLRRRAAPATSSGHIRARSRGATPAGRATSSSTTPQHDVHALEALHGLQEHLAVAHREVAALDQRDAQVARQEHLLEHKSRASRARREQHDARTLAGRTQRAQGVQPVRRSSCHALHAQLGERLGKLLRARAARFSSR